MLSMDNVAEIADLTVMEAEDCLRKSQSSFPDKGRRRCGGACIVSL